MQLYVWLEPVIVSIEPIVANITPSSGRFLSTALKTLANYEAIYAYNFEGRRYDVGDKLGFLEATVDFALKREDLKDGLLDFLREKIDSNL